MTTLFQARDPAAKFRAVQHAKVSVGGKVIPAAAISREVQNHVAATPQEAWRAAARALVVREMLLQEAHRVGLAPAPASDDEGRRETDEEALIRAVVEQAVSTPQPDAAACRCYYDRNLPRFRSADLYEAAHILLPSRQEDKEARERAREQAVRLCSLLARNPRTFAQLATEHSACPSASTGGNLGQIKPGDTVAEFDTALAAMQACEISAEPVESRYGFHIIRLDRRIEGRVLPFELVQDRIAIYLRERSTRQATAQYLALLAARTVIEGVELPAPSELGVM